MFRVAFGRLAPAAAHPAGVVQSLKTAGGFKAAFRESTFWSSPAVMGTTFLAVLSLPFIYRAGSAVYWTKELRKLNAREVVNDRFNWLHTEMLDDEVTKQCAKQTSKGLQRIGQGLTRRSEIWIYMESRETDSWTFAVEGRSVVRPRSLLHPEVNPDDEVGQRDGESSVHQYSWGHSRRSTLRLLTTVCILPQVHRPHRPSSLAVSVLHSRKLRRVWSVFGHRSPAPGPNEEDLPNTQGSNDYQAVPVYCVRFACMSRVIVTGGDDYRLRVWDAKTGRLKSTLAGHTGEVMETAVSYCDTIVASSATDKTVRLWKVSDEDQQSRPLTALQFTAEVHFMAFSPSQHHEQVFITVTCDGGIFIWDLATVTRDNAGEVLTAYCKYYLDVDCKLIRGFDTFSGPKAQWPIEPSGSILEGDHHGYLNFWFAVGCSDKCVRVFSVQPHGDRPVKMDARNPELVKYHHLEFELSGVHTQVVSHICFDNLSGDCASSDDHGGLVLWRLSSSTMYTRPRQKWIEALRLSTPLNPLPEYIELIRPIIPTGDSLIRTYMNGDITSCNLSKACPSVRGYWGHHAIRTFSWTADDRYIVCGVAENPVEDSKDETPTVPTEGREYRYGALVFEASSARLIDAVIHPSMVNGEVYVALPAKFVSPWIFCLCSYDGGVTLWRIDAEKGAQVLNKFDLSNCHSHDSHSSRQFCDGQFDGRGDFVVTDNLGCVHYFSTAQLRSSMNGVDTLLQEQFFEGDYFLGVHCTAPGERLCDAYMRPYPKSFYTGAARPMSTLKRGRSKSVYLRGLPTRGEGYTIPLAQPISIDERWASVDGRDGPPAVEDGFATPMRHSQEAAARSGVNDDSAIIEPEPRGMMTRSGRTVHRPPIYEEYDSDYTDEVSGDSGDDEEVTRHELGSREHHRRRQRRRRGRRTGRRSTTHEADGPTVEEGSAGPRRRLIHGLPSVHT
ncbi:hypothetical protein FOZ63_000715, partial [Perkinsus olseni]